MRYFHWCVFRLRCQAQTWRGGSILLLAFMSLFAIQLCVQVISSPQALGQAMELLRKQHKSEISGEGNPRGSMSEMMPLPELKDPMASPPLEDLRQALADYGKMPDWLHSLENTRMSPPGVMVMVSDPNKLTERQRRLMSIQGMILAPWTPPVENDRLTALPQYWVQWKDDPNSWVIHARSLDLSTSGDGPGSIVVLRSILWIEALDALERWEVENPAPVPPVDLHPGGVSTALIPSSAGNTMMAICATWILALALMSLWSVIQMSSWGTLRATGGWMAFAGLTHSTRKLLWAQVLLVGWFVFLASLSMGFLAWVILNIQGSMISLSWTWKTSLVISIAIVLAHVISISLQVWPSSREIRQIAGGMLAIVLAAVNLWVAGFWYNMRPLAAYFSSHGLLMLVLVFSLVIYLLIELCAWRLDSRARSGYLSS